MPISLRLKFYFSSYITLFSFKWLFCHLETVDTFCRSRISRPVRSYIFSFARLASIALNHEFSSYLRMIKDVQLPYFCHSINTGLNGRLLFLLTDILRADIIF